MQTLYTNPTLTPAQLTTSNNHMPDALSRVDLPVEVYSADYLPSELWAARIAFEFAVSAVGFGREWDYAIEYDAFNRWSLVIVALDADRQVPA